MQAGGHRSQIISCYDFNRQKNSGLADVGGIWGESAV
jgi:hypothetical protein